MRKITARVDVKISWFRRNTLSPSRQDCMGRCECFQFACVHLFRVVGHVLTQVSHVILFLTCCWLLVFTPYYIHQAITLIAPHFPTLFCSSVIGSRQSRKLNLYGNIVTWLAITKPIQSATMLKSVPCWSTNVSGSLVDELSVHRGIFFCLFQIFQTGNRE